MDLPIESLRFRHVADDKYLQNSIRKNMNARLGPSGTEECWTEGVERDIYRFVPWKRGGQSVAH